MSHVTMCAANPDQVIKSLPALMRAMGRCSQSAVFQHGQTSFQAFGSEGQRTGLECAHAIGLPGMKYEIGIMKSQAVPGAFQLAYDSYSDELEPVFGQNLENLLSFYHAEVARETANASGDLYSEQELENGDLLVTIDTTNRMGV
jgi:hypothetical protein